MNPDEVTKKEKSLPNLGKDFFACRLREPQPTIERETKAKLNDCLRLRYPNPARETALIQFDVIPENGFISITDQFGKNKVALLINSNQITIDVSSWQCGVYYLKLETNSNFVIKKFVVL